MRSCGLGVRRKAHAKTDKPAENGRKCNTAEKPGVTGLQSTPRLAGQAASEDTHVRTRTND